jgi:hypothetical protein
MLCAFWCCGHLLLLLSGSWAGEVAAAEVMVMTPDVLLHILAHGSILVR